MVILYVHIAYIAIITESDLKEDMVNALWQYLCGHDIGKPQITLENPNVTPNMFLPPDPINTTNIPY